MPIKYIVFNGPPQAGKSSVAHWTARALKELSRRKGRYPVIYVDSFSAPMKHFIASALGEKYADMNKTKARPELLGYSVRELFIHMAEHYMKDRYGEDVFARWLVHRNLKNIPAPDYVFIDDGGFKVERHALTNPVVVRVIRPGCEFTGDSREWWDNPTVYIHNSEDHEHLYTQGTKLADDLINGIV